MKPSAAACCDILRRGESFGARTFRRPPVSVSRYSAFFRRQQLSTMSQSLYLSSTGHRIFAGSSTPRSVMICKSPHGRTLSARAHRRCQHHILIQATCSPKQDRFRAAASPPAKSEAAVSMPPVVLTTGDDDTIAAIVTGRSGIR